MRTIEGSVLTEKKATQHVSHYVSPHHVAGQEVTVDGTSLALHSSVGESTGRIISIMHSNGFPSQTLCRQAPAVSDLTNDGWGTDLLETEASTGSDAPISEEDRRLTAALVQFVQQNGRHPTVHDLTHIAKEEQVELRTSIIEVSNEPPLPSLPPLPLLKRAPNSDWYPMRSTLQYNPKTYLIKNIEDTEGVLETEECEIEVTNAAAAAAASFVHTKQHHNKKSLPHKKRISRKLKKPHNNLSQMANGQSQFPIDVQETVEIIQDASHHEVLDVTEHHSLQTAHIVDTTTHEERALFICQLCGDFYGGDQMQFYHHLKEHYEPHNTTIIIENSMGTLQHHSVMDKMCVSNAPLPEALVELSLEATVPDKSLYDTQGKLSTYDTENKILFNTTDKASLFVNDKMTIYQQPQKQTQQRKFYATLEKPLFACIHCPKTFRRQKQYELHAREAHSKVDEMSEFSEPEDLMEGIHVVVEPENEEYLQEEISSHHSNTLLMQGTITGQEQYILPHLTIDNGHVNQEHLNNKEWYMKQALGKDPGELGDTNSNSISDGECEARIPDNEGDEDSEDDNVGEISCPLCGGSLPSRKQYAEHAQQCHQHLNEEVQRMMEVEAEAHDAIAGEENGRLDEEERVEEMEEEMHSDKSNENSSAQKKKNVLTCPECERTFRHRNSLIYHMLSHNGTRTFICGTCKKSFFTSGALKVHERLHNGDKPYRCESCGRMFRQWGDLKYHFISIHSNQKQHQCEYCGKDFARKYSLIVHRRIHTGEKNYRCDFCDKSFRASSYLQNHRRIHTGEKPHPCSVCGKRFRMKGDMKRHLSTHTKEKLKYLDDDKSSEVEEKAAPPKRGKNKLIALSEVTPKKEMKIEKQEKQDESDKEDSGVSRDGKDGQTLSEEGISSNESSIPVQGETRMVSTFPSDNNPMYMWPVFT